MTPKNNRSFSIPPFVRNLAIGLVLLLIAIPVIFGVGGQFVYLLETVGPGEVGLQLRGGQVENVVGPGVYSDVGLYVDLKRVSSAALPFSVRDEEIITSDKQRIGLVVTGDLFRPGTAQKDILLSNWAQYSQVYLDDTVALDRAKSLVQQAMKVCVGSRKFDDAIIGTARDELRSCIDDETSKLADNYGLTVANVVVPEVVLSPEVQAALDSIVASRLATEKAAQDKLKADAEALAEQARQEGEIRVEQSRIQEEARQQTLLAKLQQERLIAEQAVIEAEKANELLAAQQDLEINRALANAAEEKARADLAQQRALAELYAANPAYLQLQIAQANASALKPTDKIIFTPEGTTPTIVLPGPGITPTVDTVTPQ
jgi:hypothetical protein